MKHTKTETERACRKVEIAINKIIDLKDIGFGCDTTERILEQLNHLLTLIRDA